MLRRLALVLLLGVAIVAPAASARALDQTWSGSWYYRGENYTLAQKGMTVTGMGDLTKSQITATVNGSVLTGKWFADKQLKPGGEPGVLYSRCEYIRWTMDTGGKVFDAVFGADVWGTAGVIPSCPPTSSLIPTTGECKGGACLQNTSQAVKPSIVGTWSYLGGSVRVTASRSGFVGVVATSTSEKCKRVAGQRIWELSGAGPYTGTHVALSAPGCKTIKLPATFTVAKDKLKLCTTAAGKKTCSTLGRLKS